MLKIKNILAIILFGFLIGVIIYNALYLPYKYKNNFINSIRNYEIKEVYIYDYVEFGNEFSAYDNRNQKIYNLLKRLRGIENEYSQEFAKRLEIYKVISVKKIEPMKIKKINEFLVDLETTSKGEGIGEPFLLRIIFKNRTDIWCEFGKGGISKNNKFIIDFMLDFKYSMEFRNIKYLWFNLGSQGSYRAPKLEKFFDKFKLFEWKKENRRKLNARNNNGDN